MSKINDITEAWNGHTNKEVEDFIKENIGGQSSVIACKFTVDMSKNLTIASTEITKEDLFAAARAGIVIIAQIVDGSNIIRSFYPMWGIQLNEAGGGTLYAGFSDSPFNITEF